MKKLLAVGFVALVIGAAGGAYGGVRFADGIPVDFDSREVEAEVLDEVREEERLVLTVRAEEETFLATFSERADDVDSLVSVGDTIVLRMPNEAVFADDVPILSVRAAEPSEEDVAEEEGDAEEGDEEEGDEEEEEAQSDEEDDSEEEANDIDAEGEEEQDPVPLADASEGRRSLREG